MTHFSYLHLDVFAEGPFSGNQLAVFPDAVGLDADQMQQIAAEMAFSETAFVFPPESNLTDFRVRIFTPAKELPMAGHPTIGTTFALAQERRIDAGRETVMLGVGVGPTAIALEWEKGSLRFAWMTQAVPTLGATPRHIDLLARALGVDAREIHDTGLPAQEGSSGVPFLFVPLASRNAVDRAGVERSTLRRFFDASGLPELPVFVFSLEPARDDATVYSRMFAPLFGIAEDPATGGACGPLGGYLVHHGVVTAEHAQHMVNRQGVAMGRPSRIVISVQGDNSKTVSVRVGGTSLVVGGGFLEVP